MPTTWPSSSSAGPPLMPAAERAAEEDLRIEAAPDQAVVGALGDREADVERVAERVDALALRQRLRLAGGTRSASKLPARPASAGLQQRQVVQHVELQDLQRRLAAVGGDVDEVVALGLQRRLADDVEVGDDVALARRRRSPSRPRSGWPGPSARCGSGPAASAPARRPCAPRARPAPTAARRPRRPRSARGGAARRWRGCATPTAGATERQHADGQRQHRRTSFIREDSTVAACTAARRSPHGVRANAALLQSPRPPRARPAADSTRRHAACNAAA